MDEFTSPFSEYLHSNYVPSSIQKVHLHGFLRKPKAALIALDDEISRLQSTLNTIKKQRDCLDETIREYNQLLTPFRRLPDDILGEIFIWCLPDEHNAVMRAADPPLLLGRICTRWRSLAYNNPRLWATLHLSSPLPPTNSGDAVSFWVPDETNQKLRTDFEQLFQHHRKAVQDWLDRSHSLPLSISIDLGCENGPISQSPYTRAYLDTVLTSSHRWRSLEISIPAREHPAFLASIQFRSVPCLEFLYIRFPRRPASQLDMWKTSNLLKAEKLHVLHLVGNTHRLSKLEVDWTRITHLILSNSALTSRNRRVTLKEAFSMFISCKRLQYCLLEIIDTADAVSPSGVIPLPHLESLAIMDGAFCLATLIECLKVPSLRNITYFSKFAPSTSRPLPLILLLRQTSNRVESLTTTLQFHTVADIVECFELVPLLNRLTNTYSWSTIGPSDQSRWGKTKLPFAKKMMKAILDLLLPNNSSGECLCPNLHTLDLKQSLGLTDQDALNFLQQRLDASRAFNGIERLAKVCIKFTSEMTVDMQTRLRCYINEGLKLDFEFPTPRNPSPWQIFNPLNGLITPIVKRESGHGVIDASYSPQ